MRYSSGRLLLLVTALCWQVMQPATAFASPSAPPAPQPGDTVSVAEFTQPPISVRPWVYWFWLNGNITREGITADLEAMHRVGIGGVLIMEVDQGAPAGPVAFGSPAWREIFRFVCSEAHRLGLQVNMTNDAGWCGSGGPWITPALSMQKVVWTETQVNGPGPVDELLPQPGSTAGYYEDIAVLAFPTPADDAYRLPDIAGKSSLVRQDLPPPPAIPPTTTPERTIPRRSVVDLTASFHDGRLSWSVPAGKWTVVRFGHTSTGVENHPAPAPGLGLESDKLSAQATEAQFAGLMQKLAADNGPLTGKTLVTTHIDSWETGSQNWTPTFREDFRRLRGYDLLPYLPTFTGRVVESADVTERFLWDLRQTVSDLLVTNYAGHFRTLAQQHGLKLSIEAYGDCPTDDMAYAGRADEPMGEFWSWPNNGEGSCTEMSSAAHTYGKRILGAEAFTATDGEKWQHHPATIKILGDWAFCEGINRFVVHRYAMQPWINRKPGMSMGPWGLHYERTQTWWEQSKPWHTYLARCQDLLRKGLFVADICYLQAEGAPRPFGPPIASYSGGTPDRPGYNFDGCTSEVVLTRMTVKQGRLVLPDGMSYRVLSLPDAATMTPKLLRRIAELVDAGATVVGPRPVRSPSLGDYPGCDAEVTRIADRLWGNGDGKRVTERRVGKGRVISGKTAEQVLAADGVPKDFVSEDTAPFRYTHRHLPDGTDLYFVANKSELARQAVCSFRVSGRIPELWQPQTGNIEPAAAWRQAGGVTRIPLRLEGAESLFVLFRKPSAGADPIVALARNGTPILPPPHAAAGKIVIRKASYGPPGDAARTLDVREKLQALADSGVRRFQVAEMAQGNDPAYGVVKTLDVDYTVNGKPLHVSGTDPDEVDLREAAAAVLTAQPRLSANGRLEIQAWREGSYRLQTASGRTLSCETGPLAPPLQVAGPWNLQFPPNLGAPPSATLGRLVSWSDHSDPGISHFSGTAAYRTTLEAPRTLFRQDRQLTLDLGRVEVMARVKVNGKDLGILWKSPYSIDVTHVLKPGKNSIEIQVTNLWINRMIGDEQLPEDSDRNPDGTLKSWPTWLQGDKPSPTGRITFTSWRLWKHDSPLQPSGLIGPVTVTSSAVMRAE